MAKGVAECKCATCGKTFEVERTLYNRTLADSWAKWAEERFNECGACYQAAKTAKRDAVNSIAAADADKKGLVDLTGSPKQIAWAATIRKAMLDQIAEIRQALSDEKADDLLGEVEDEIEAAIGQEKNVEEIKKILDVSERLILAQPQSAWFIDHRSSLGYAHLFASLWRENF